MKLLLFDEQATLATPIKSDLMAAGYHIDQFDPAEPEQQFDTYHALLVDQSRARSECSHSIETLRLIAGDTALIVVLGDGHTDAVVQALKTGADDYIHLPITQSELSARLERNIERAQRLTPSRKFQIKHVTIDMNSMSIHSNGRESRLTRQEYQLLELLINNRGKVVSRVEIINFAGHSKMSANLIEVLIHKLRSKLGKESITTIRGLGYMIPSH